MKTSVRRLWGRVATGLCALLLVLCAAWTCVPARAYALAETPAADPFEDAAAVDLADGSYTVDVTLEGGSGRASVSSPAQLTVLGGKAALEVVWSSPSYDYMLVAGKTYLPTNTDGNSTFEIPVLALGGPFDVVGDTTAMSEPHEIDYQLTLDAASIQAVEEKGAATAGLPLPLVAGVAAAACICAVVLLPRKDRDG